MDAAMMKLISHLERTLVRQEAAVKATRDQLDAARKAMDNPNVSLAGAKK